MHAIVRQLITDDDGATMVEYGLLIALIAIVVAGAALLLGGNLKTVFSNASNCTADATQC